MEGFETPQDNPEQRKKRRTRIAEERAELEGGEMHSSNLYDQDEDAGGERVDLATGKPYDNSTATAEQIDNLSEREGFEEEEGDDATDDEAARWLAENDPDLREGNDRKAA